LETSGLYSPECVEGGFWEVQSIEAGRGLLSRTSVQWLRPFLVPTK
jgi:hypothetical protein